MELIRIALLIIFLSQHTPGCFISLLLKLLVTNVKWLLIMVEQKPGNSTVEESAEPCELRFWENFPRWKYSSSFQNVFAKLYAAAVQISFPRIECVNGTHLHRWETVRIFEMGVIQHTHTHPRTLYAFSRRWAKQNPYLFVLFVLGSLWQISDTKEESFLTKSLFLSKHCEYWEFFYGS